MMPNIFSPCVVRPLLAVLVFSFMLFACTSRQVTVAPSPMSSEAQTNYDYLVYQDLVSQLQHHAAAGEKSHLSQKQVDAIYARAEKALDKLLSEAPTPQLYMEKASLCWNVFKERARARGALKEGLEKFSDSPSLTLALADLYLLDDHLDEALDVLEDHLSLYPEHIAIRERLGMLLMDAGKDAESLDELNKIPLKKRSADVLHAIGRVQGNMGMRKAAIATLQKALEQDPGFTDAMVELAYQYELAKDYVAAEEMYTQILGQDEPLPGVRLRLINMNLKLNNPHRALDVALGGSSSKSFILDAALMFITDEFYAQGSTVLDKLMSGEDAPAEYYFYKAVIANEGEQDQEKALDFLSQVKETERLYPHALRFKAQIYNVQGKVDEALGLARSGIADYPDASIFYILESALLMERDSPRKAEAALAAGLKRLPNNPELTYELAMIYEKLDKRAEGLRLMEEVLRSHPDHVNALNYVGYTLAEEGRELERAIVLVQKAANLEPENGYVLDSVAWVHFKAGRLQTAWETINDALSLVDDEPILWEHYGDIATALGKRKQAVRGYKKALQKRSKDHDRIKQKLSNL